MNDGKSPNVSDTLIHREHHCTTAIGKSFLKDDIFAMKITANGTSSSKGKMLLTGGVHAREYAPPELLMRFATDILEKYDKDADATWILEHTEIHIIFYVNPDGRQKAEEEPNTMWRKNVDPGSNKCSGSTYGVDINRNFDFLWGDINGASKRPCDDDYMGSSAGSETETQALTEYAKSLFPEAQRKTDPVAQMDDPFGEDIMGLYMDIHAYGGFTYYRKFSINTILFVTSKYVSNRFWLLSAGCSLRA
jgi:hypothetical protein